MSGDVAIPPYDLAAGRLVTARSYLIDRITPACEIVHLPPRTLPGATLGLTLGPATVQRPKTRGALSRFKRPRPARDIPKDRILIDLRGHTPQNWAHFLNNHLPLTFCLSDKAGIEPARLLAVLPADTPLYILGAAKVFGLDTLCSDATISGQVLQFDIAPWIAVRNLRHRWAQLPWPSGKLAQNPRDTPLPQDIFLSRRGTRTLLNEDEVADFLSQRGFHLVYAEDHTAADQIRLITQARRIVAIHGAGLAPLLYRAPDGPKAHLIELMPCGHMTDVYRVMAQQVGVDWIGVRGRIKPEYIAPAYAFTDGFSAFSLDPFHIDVHSLDAAFAMAEEDALPAT